MSENIGISGIRKSRTGYQGTIKAPKIGAFPMSVAIVVVTVRTV